MHQEQRKRTAHLLSQAGVEQALFSDFDSVRWLAGCNCSAPALIWYDRGAFTLLVDEGFRGAESFGREPDCQVIPFTGYTISQPIDKPARLAEALAQAMGPGQSGSVGVEAKSLSLDLWQTVQRARPGCEVTPMDGWLLPLRAVKTEEELARIREGFRLVTVGHEAARQAVQVGQREIDVWAEVRSAVEKEAGQWMEMGNDCIVGHRQANIGGPPLDHEILANDSFILDLSVLVEGYWTDSCATYYANEPTPQQREMHNFVTEALAFAISLIRPGALAKEVDQQVRQFMADGGYAVYPHHTGHGVGLTGHEAPRIVPYNTEVIQEGQVILLEPGIYLPGVTGVRLEHAVLVTENGSEQLSHHETALPPAIT